VGFGFVSGLWFWASVFRFCMGFVSVGVLVLELVLGPGSGPGIAFSPMTSPLGKDEAASAVWIASVLFLLLFLRSVMVPSNAVLYWVGAMGLLYGIWLSMSGVLLLVHLLLGFLATWLWCYVFWFV